MVNFEEGTEKKTKKTFFFKPTPGKAEMAGRVFKININKILLFMSLTHVNRIKVRVYINVH